MELVILTYDYDYDDDENDVNDDGGVGDAYDYDYDDDNCCHWLIRHTPFWRPFCQCRR